MSSYNVTASRFSLPNSGLADSGGSKVKDNAMSVSYSISLLSSGAGDTVVCGACARTFIASSSGAFVTLDGLSSYECGLWLISPVPVVSGACEFCTVEFTPAIGCTLTISLGRNVPKSRVSDIPYMVLNDIERDTHELTDDAWLRFQCAVDEFRGTGIADTKALGHSKYLGESEETCVLQWFSAEPLTERERAMLSNIREEFGQDSIAVSYTAPEFI